MWSQGALYLSCTPLISVVINYLSDCLTSEFLTLTPTITLHTLLFVSQNTDHRQWVSQSSHGTLHSLLGANISTRSKGEQEPWCASRRVLWMQFGSQSAGVAESKCRSKCSGCRVTAEDGKHLRSCQNLLGKSHRRHLSGKRRLASTLITWTWCKAISPRLWPPG